jgi:HEPN domain-containing protein
MEALKYNYGSINNKIDYHTTVFLHPDGVPAVITDWKEKLLAILQGLPDKTDNIKPLIQLLVVTIAPAKIYMMKQEAAENGNSDTIIDLLIVLTAKPGITFPELEPILNIASSQNSRVICSLHNEGNVLEGLRNGHYFYCLHCNPENLVYDDKVKEYPIVPAETLAAIKRKALEEFNHHFQKAEDFYKIAVMLYQDQPQPSPLIMFMLHQAVEFIYRGSLQSLNGYDKKTHEIRVLMRHVRHHTRQLNSVFTDNVSEGTRIIQLLDKAYSDARYEEKYTINEKDLAFVFEKVDRLHKLAKKMVESTLWTQ